MLSQHEHILSLMGSSMAWIFARACRCILNQFKLTEAIITWRYMNVFQTQVNESDTMDFVLSLLSIEFLGDMSSLAQLGQR